jgi:putative Mn2+ efflux pump MntP
MERNCSAVSPIGQKMMRRSFQPSWDQMVEKGEVATAVAALAVVVEIRSVAVGGG